jgi:predicted protein tyrosine phosphatase
MNVYMHLGVVVFALADGALEAEGRLVEAIAAGGLGQRLLGH